MTHRLVLSSDPMHEPNIPKIFDQLRPTDTVLDIGGWACPFNRADYVMDAFPYESRGYYRLLGRPPSQGGAEEHFTRETWIQRDICDREPFPFEDKQIDFVICSHTLEDIRDPLWVCSEMVRIAKRGYVEVPSRLFESIRDVETRGMVGLSHHRWLIDVEPGAIRFVQKFHSIHTDWRYSLPRSTLSRVPDEALVQWLFWEGSFSFREDILHGHEAQEAELHGFVQKHAPYGPLRLAWGRAADSTRSLLAGARTRAGGAWRAIRSPRGKT